MLRISITSKFEMLITQLFKQYNDSVAIDYSTGTIISTKMDAFKYSIIKSIRDYRPQEILSAIHSNPQRIPSLLVEFYRKKISQNERNMNLKRKENQAFNQAISIIEGISPNICIDWSYSDAFLDFLIFLNYLGIRDSQYKLIIDNERYPERKTVLNAAISAGVKNAKQGDSAGHIGIQMADIMAGIVGKLLVKMSSNLLENATESLEKRVLPSVWFMINQREQNLYKKLNKIIQNANHYRVVSENQIYRDDWILFLSLLDFMSQIDSYEIAGSNTDIPKNEKFNNLCIYNLQSYFNKRFSQ